MAKKKIAKYMYRELCKIAKEEVLLLHPELNSDKYLEKTRKNCKKEIEAYFNAQYDQDKLKQVEEYGLVEKGIINLYTNVGNIKVFLDILIPTKYSGNYTNRSKEVNGKSYKSIARCYEQEASRVLEKLNDDIKTSMQQHMNIINSAKYLEDIIKFGWKTPKVCKYIDEITGSVASTALATISDIDIVNMTRMSEKIAKKEINNK